jgi:osmotically-inducible protein OsmY
MSDKELQQAVMRELEWDPKVNESHIGVAVNGGAVTLAGHVPSYSMKLAAIRAAERVFGVKAVADEIEVKLPGNYTRDDTDIAEEIARELNWNTVVPPTVDVEVRSGFVTLRGTVQWSFERAEAERAVRNITGVRGVTNLITVKSTAKPKPTDIEQRVTDAIKRMADLDARSIWVTTSNGTVHLHGHVHSLYEKRVAENAAAAAPGVTNIDNEIVVVP